MSGKKPVIVAIDDEVDYTLMMDEYFKLRDYEIYVATKSVEGIRLITEKKPDIVILDLKMPGINGEEILKLTKKISTKAEVIFVTAYDDGGATRSRMLKSGAYAYLDKPLPSLKDLEKEVLEAFKGGRGK